VLDVAQAVPLGALLASSSRLAALQSHVLLGAATVCVVIRLRPWQCVVPVPERGKWFISSPKFRDWLSGPASLTLYYYYTNYFKNKTLKEEIESKCRLCKQHEETLDHLTSECPILAKNECLMRHDKDCTHLHYSICKALGIETTEKGTHTHTCPSQCMKRETSQCCGIKQYTQTWNYYYYYYYYYY
jgi:hypothetical protein